MRPSKAIAARCATVILAASTASGSWFGYLRASGNFHSVVVGEVYRSAQPTSADIWIAQEEHGIRTILNLRGAKPGRVWYDREAAAARKLGIRLVDFKMSAGKALSKDRTAELVRLLRTLPKPLLIHCKAGADRTGLASALYLAVVKEGDVDTAEWQLSARYGHIGIPVFGAAWAMDETWDAAEDWFQLDD